jgi:hypothetical protein
MGGMTAERGERAEGADAKSSGLADQCRARPERDQLALDLPSQRARQLQRVALPAAEETGGPKWGGYDVDHAHVDG